MNESADSARSKECEEGLPFWAALSAALGAGLFSGPAIERILESAGLPPLGNFAALGEDEPCSKSAGFMLLLGGSWCFLLGMLLWYRCPEKPPLRRWLGRVAVAYYAAASLAFIALAYEAVEVFESYPNPFPVFLVAMGIPCFIMALFHPRDAFFCANLGVVVFVHTMQEDYLLVDAKYLATVPMAFIFLYVIGGIWMQRIVALVLLVPMGVFLYRIGTDSVMEALICFVHGAVAGSVVWFIRGLLKRRARLARVAREEPV